MWSRRTARWCGTGYPRSGWRVYDRFEGEVAYRQLAELYRAVRLYVNFFQPSVKLLTKIRDGSRVKRTYDAAATPLHRLLVQGALGVEERERLEAIYRGLDPVLLLRQIGILQEALWRHARFASPITTAEGGTRPYPMSVPFEIDACAPGNGASTAGVDTPISEGRVTRKYHRSERPRVERYWRTREDPFEEVREEIIFLLEASPERTAKSVFEQLQGQYPGRFPDVQLRTLQRRVKEWRENSLVEFDDGWLRGEVLTGDVSPPRLRASVEPEQAPNPALVVQSAHPQVVSAAQPML